MSFVSAALPKRCAEFISRSYEAFTVCSRELLPRRRADHTGHHRRGFSRTPDHKRFAASRNHCQHKCSRAKADASVVRHVPPTAMSPAVVL